VPEHWEVKRLKWVTRLQRGYDLPQDHRKPGVVPVVSSGGVIDTHYEARARGPGVVMGRYGSTDAVFGIFHTNGKVVNSLLAQTLAWRDGDAAQPRGNHALNPSRFESR
jgi:hypothetical protein